MTSELPEEAESAVTPAYSVRRGPPCLEGGAGRADTGAKRAVYLSVFLENTQTNSY